MSTELVFYKEDMDGFLALVQDMRCTQKEYFKTRDRVLLQKSKQLEKLVDIMVARLTEK